MKNKNCACRSVFTSVIALVCCFAMLLGSTFAWFTDTVFSTGNVIQSGSLKVDMSHKVGNSWISIKANPTHKVFNYKKWEPGYTRVENFKVENLGTLALQYKLSIAVDNGTEVLGENGQNLADVIDVYVTYGESNEKNYNAIISNEAWSYKGTLAEVIADPDHFIGGQILPEGEAVPSDAAETTAAESQTVSIALHMRDNAGNGYQGLSIGNVRVNLVAAQWTYEMDSFDSNYDSDPDFPIIPTVIYSAAAPVTVNMDGTVASAVTIGNEGGKFNAYVPAGVKLNNGVYTLGLTVGVVSERQADVTLNGGDVVFPLDIHVDGVAEDNTVPVTVIISDVFPKGLASYNVDLYHVENGETVAMTSVESLDELDAHNEFYYDAVSGRVTVCLASFSEVSATVAVANPWDGKTVDTSWYNTTDTDFTLNDAADLAGFAQIVGGMAAGIGRDNFAGKTVKLGADVNMGGTNNVIFTPVGYYFTDDRDGNGTPSENKADIYSTVYAFRGTFDGQGHTVSNILQRTWDIKGDDEYYNLPAEQYYRDGMGLFGYVYNGTVKNLAVVNFQSEGEYCYTGCVAAYAAGTTLFENIRVVNSNPRTYNVPNGGIVGSAYDTTDSAGNAINGDITFKNIIIDDTTKISALWGSWDVACGGILGRMGDNTKVTMTDCAVAAEIDVYNDVCGNYQYYQFRYCGMLIGTAGSDSDPSDQIANVTFTDCYVRYGNWATHYYCELVSNSKASYTHDYQFSRLEKIGAIGEISPDGGKTWFKTGNFYLNGECYHIVKDSEGNLVEHKHEDAGTEVINGETVLVEDNQVVEIRFNQIYTGYGWGSSPSATGINVSEYIYSITYMCEGKVYDVVYVTDNTKAVSVANKAVEDAVTAGTSADQVFEKWVNAGSFAVTEVKAGNTENVVLYPDWRGAVHTARFVDQNGNLIYETIFREGDTQLTAEPDVPKVPYCTGAWSDYTLGKSDITIYPTYTIDSSKLAAIAKDSDNDGDIDHYEIQMVNELETEGETKKVEIPGYINGIPVKVVTNLGSTVKGDVQVIEIHAGVEIIESEAFAYTPDLKTVYLPKTITKLEAKVASRQGQDKKDDLTICYAGTGEDWEKVLKNSSDEWCTGMRAGCKVVCTDGTFVKTGGQNQNDWSWTANPTT